MEGATPATFTQTPPKRGARPSQRWRRVGTFAARLTLGLALLGSLLLSLTPGGRTATRAALLLPALVTATEPAPLLLLGDPIRHTTLVADSADGPVYLDLYAPTTPAPPIPGLREGLLLIPGVGDNRAVPQLVNLAQSLARSGIVAMAMTTNPLMAYTLTPTTIDAVVVATQILQHTRGVGKVGIVGLSAGGSLGALAAADPRIRDSLAFALSFGGYYDAPHLLRDLGRRALDVDGALRPWQPDPVPVQALANTIAQTLPAEDATLLTSGFNTFDGLELSTSDQARLSPAGLAAYHLLTGDDPQRVDAHLAALPPQAQALLRSLSPSGVIGKLHAPIYLLHDQADIYVPFTESRDFAAALATAGRPHQFVELTIFQHVEVKSGLSIGPTLHDGGALYQLFLAMLAPDA